MLVLAYGVVQIFNITPLFYFNKLCIFLYHRDIVIFQFEYLLHLYHISRQIYA